LLLSKETIMTPLLNITDLPPLFRELIDLIGEPAALQLVSSRPGLRVYIPHTEWLRRQPDNWLTALLGAEAAQTLSKRYAHTWLKLPKLDSIQRESRHQEIVRCYHQGESPAQLAIRFGYTERHIERILAKLRQPIVGGSNRPLVQLKLCG
jgi:hypothetical protein